MNSDPEARTPWWADRQVTKDEQAVEVRRLLAFAVPMMMLAWWRVGPVAVVWVLVIGGAVGMLTRRIPAEVRQNPKIWVTYQIAVVLAMAGAALLIAT